jgi:hypothetical protein
MMELFPGKQLFVDDFFIESLRYARRVLNRPVKITVEQPLELGFDKPWDRALRRPSLGTGGSASTCRRSCG